MYPLADYPNVSGVIGALISEKYATLYELQTVYSLEDAYNMADVIKVNNYNAWAQSKESEKK